ncbi:MAG: hypothetical protein PHX40_01865 [Bacilli bacterium]|nr:hypothetical protein [Bacilli bacterium]
MDKPLESTLIKDYLSHIFNGNFDNVMKYNVNYLITAQRYKDEYHDPYAKYEGDSSLYLKNSDLFLNLTAEIIIGDKKQYITLATFGTKDTILNKGLKNVIGDTTDLKNKIEAFYDKIEHSLPLETTNFLKVSDVSKENFSILTGTRIVSKDKDNKTKHYLHTLKNNIPGLQYSTMRLFPGNFKDFSNYVNRYTFSQERDEKKMEYLFKLLKNKPHIVVSFDNKLNGNSDKKAQAKLMPIGSESRKIPVIIDEILKLKKDVFEETSNYYKFNPTGKYTPSREINAKFETILNASQILDMLIT